MKRLAFFFDGTWQKLAGLPTNVVLTAASIKRQTNDGTVQIIHYDEGVGTGPDDENPVDGLERVYSRRSVRLFAF
jgi:uncharacterized protein (DUF2235 family)